MSFCVLEFSFQAIEKKRTQGGEGGDANKLKPPNSKQFGVGAPHHFMSVFFVLWNLLERNLGALAMRRLFASQSVTSGQEVCGNAR